MKSRFITLVALLIAVTRVAAQDSGTIIFNGYQVEIQGIQFSPVTDEKNVWEIELKDNKVKYALDSKNDRHIKYTSDKQAFEYEKNNQVIMSDQIPCLVDRKNNNKETGRFYDSAKLVLSKDLMPIKIYVGDSVVAEFREKGTKKVYQQYLPLEKKDYLVGEKIELKLNTCNYNIPIKGIEIYVKTSESTSIELKDGTIKETCLNGKDSITTDIKIKIHYEDNIEKEEWFTGITLKKTPKEEWIVIAEVIGIVAVVAFILFLLLHKRRHDKETKRKRTSIISKIRRFFSGDKSSPNGGTTPDSNKPTPGGTVDPGPPPPDDGAEIQRLNQRIAELESSLQGKIDALEKLSSDYKTLTQNYNTLYLEFHKIISDNASKKDLRNKIEELKRDNQELKSENQRLARELSEAKQTITTKIKEKDDQISEIKKLKDKAESDLRIEKNTTATLQKKINLFSRQTYYLYAIDDALEAMDKSLKSLFMNVHDENLMKRLAQPVLSGTAGLDAGLESYLAEWKESVYDNQSQFFGSEAISMSDESVKEKLTEFLEQLALRDSFGKLVRLYLMTNVGWINEKMVAAGFDVDAIQTLFVRFKNLLHLFDIEISYPHLFVDKFDSKLHKDNMRCEIFNYFEPSEELLTQLKKRENENLIVDVTRIGIPNSKNPTRRNAMVSLPNF